MKISKKTKIIIIGVLVVALAFICFRIAEEEKSYDVFTPEAWANYPSKRYNMIPDLLRQYKGLEGTSRETIELALGVSENGKYYLGRNEDGYDTVFWIWYDENDNIDYTAIIVKT